MVENNLRNHVIKPCRGDHPLIVKLLSDGHPYGILCFGSISFYQKVVPTGQNQFHICLIYELPFHSIVLPLMQYHTKGL